MNPNNPYNFPQRPQNLHLLEKSNLSMNRTDSQEIRNARSPPSNGNLLPQGLITVANMFKKNTLQTPKYESSEAMKAPPLPNQRQATKRIISNQKSQNSFSHRSSPHTSLKDSRGSNNTSLTIEGGQNATNLRQSIGTNNFEFKELQQKLNVLMNEAREQDKRIRALENKSDENSSSKFNSAPQQNVLKTLIEKAVNKKILEMNQSVQNLSMQVNQCLHECSEIKMSSPKHSQIKLNREFEKIIGSVSQDMEAMKRSLQQKIQKNLDFLTGVISRIQKKIQNSDFSIKKSMIRFPKSALLIRYMEQFKVGQKKIIITNSCYCIDPEGYLLDEDQYYLLNSSGKQIKLDENHLKLLKQNKIL